MIGTRIWAYTRSNKNLFHAFPDGASAACGEPVRPAGVFFGDDANPLFTDDEVKAVADTDDVPGATTFCRPCYDSVVRITLGATKGADMADDILEAITANTERVATLRREGNASGAAELADETLRVIETEIKGKGAVARKSAAKTALAESLITPLAPAPSTEIVGASPTYKELPGAEKLVAESAAKLREGVKLGLKMSGMSREVAEVLWGIRLGLKNKHGLPDMMAQSQGARDAKTDVSNAALEGVPEDDVDFRSLHATVTKGVQYQMSQVMVDWLRALDGSDLEEVRTYFPGLEVPEGGTISGAVRALYSGVGIELPTKSEGEKKAELVRIKAAERKALESAGGTADGDTEDPEDEGKTPFERIETKQLKAAKLLTAAVKGASKLSDAEREATKAKLTAMATTLIAQAAAL